ncbi:MAG: ABC transporter substrate-binding protein [Candidatus Bathyarchaeia archaeon]
MTYRFSKIIGITLIFFMVISSYASQPITDLKAKPDTLVLLHPHSADVANDVINDFQNWYKEKYGNSVTVQQLTMDSGACYQQVKTWDGTPEADVMWGGGEYYFISLADKGLLEEYQVEDDENIEDAFGGWPLKDPEGKHRWYAAALSSFGLMWNEDYLEAHDLSTPEKWEDLTNPDYYGHITMCDPAKSGSTTFTVIMVIQHFISQEGWKNNATGWQNSWKYWSKVAGNMGLFTESSHAVPTKVVTGEYGIGIVIDYYAWEQIKAGENIDMNNGGATSISADPAGILKGAPHLGEAKSWMDYLTSKRGQEIVGRHRMPIRKDSLPTTPVLSAWFNASHVPIIPTYSREIHNSIFGITREMFSYWLVKNHEKVRSSWRKIIECKELNLENYHEYNSAIEYYTEIPENSDTLQKALQIDPEEEIASWETWGDTKFESAETAAQEALNKYQQEKGQNSQMQQYMYFGIGVIIIVLLGIIYVYYQRK